MALRFRYVEHREVSAKLRKLGHEHGVTWFGGARNLDGERDVIVVGVDREGRLRNAHSRFRRRYRLPRIPAPEGTGPVVEITVLPGPMMLAMRTIGPPELNRHHLFYCGPRDAVWHSGNEALEASNAYLTTVASDGSACAGWYTTLEGEARVFAVNLKTGNIATGSMSEHSYWTIPIAMSGDKFLPLDVSAPDSTPPPEHQLPESSTIVTHGAGGSLSLEGARNLGLPHTQTPLLRFSCDPGRTFCAGVVGKERPVVIRLDREAIIQLAPHREFGGPYILQRILRVEDQSPESKKQIYPAIGRAWHRETSRPSILLWPNILEPDTPPVELALIIEGFPLNLRVSHVLHATNDELLLLGSTGNTWKGYRAFSAVRID